MIGRTGVALLFGLASALPTMALGPDEILRDPKLEARARTISSELRCVVCQNQSIDDSDAPLARDLRMLVRTRLQAGDSNEAVRTFVASRYGDFVLLRPPFGWHTALLWGGPAVLVLAVGAGLVAAGRRQRPRSEPPLTAAENEALRRIVTDGVDDGRVTQP